MSYNFPSLAAVAGLFFLPLLSPTNRLLEIARSSTCFRCSSSVNFSGSVTGCSLLVVLLRVLVVVVLLVSLVLLAIDSSSLSSSSVVVPVRSYVTGCDGG